VLWARLRRNGLCQAEFGDKGFESSAVDSEGGRVEQVLKRTAGGEVKANTAGGEAHAGSDFEELGAQVSIYAARQGRGNCKRKRLTRL
jgi:hypothetical protein